MAELILYISNGYVVNVDKLKEILLKLKDGQHMLTIKDLRRRSLPQNAYYWSVVVPMVRKGLYDIGYDDVRTNEDAHEVLKYLFIKKEVINKQTGEFYNITGHSKDLNIPEFQEYLESICRWAVENLGVVIPSPNEQLIRYDQWENELTNEVTT